jgi:hypothetical protein
VKAVIFGTLFGLLIIFLTWKLERYLFVVYAEDYLNEAYDRGYDQGLLKCNEREF